jgi:hypothetical protein
VQQQKQSTNPVSKETNVPRRAMASTSLSFSRAALPAFAPGRLTISAAAADAGHGISASCGRRGER